MMPPKSDNKKSFVPAPKEVRDHGTISQKIDALCQLKDAQASTATQLAIAEYNNRKALESLQEQSWEVSQSINGIIGDRYDPESVTIDGLLFVRKPIKRDGFEYWEWVLTETMVIDTVGTTVPGKEE
jgi:hypothetical protein